MSWEDFWNPAAGADILSQTLEEASSGWTLSCEDLKNVPMIGEGLSWFCYALTDFWNTLQSIGKNIYDYVQSFINFVAGLPQDIAEGIGSAILGVAEPLFGKFEKWVMQELPDMMDSAMTYIAAPEVAPSIGTAITSTRREGRLLFEYDMLDWILSCFSPLAPLALTLLKYVFEYPPPADPEKALKNIARLMTVNFWLGTAPLAVTAIIDLLHPIKRTWIPNIIQSFYFGLGLNWMTWTIWSQVFRHTILNPLDQYYAEKYRDHWPSRTEWEEWLRKRIIDFKEFEKGLAKLGYNDVFIARHLQSAWKDVSESAATKMYEYGLIDDYTFMWYIKRLGYAEDDAQRIYQLHTYEIFEPQKEATRSLVLSAYRLGLLPREEAIQQLVKLGYRKEVAELMIRVEEAKEHQDIEELKIKIVLEDLKDGIIDIDACTERLTELGVDKEKARLMCQYAYAQRRGPEREKITKADVRTLFVHGVIDKATAIEWLQRLGYSATVAADLVAVWHLEATSKEKELTRSIIERAYKLGILPREVALEQLKRLGYREEDAKIILAIIDRQQELDLLELKQKIVLEDLKDGVITAEEAVKRLKQLGVDLEAAKALVELTLARKRVERRERLTKADVRAMLIHGFITEKEAIELLKNIGYAESVAQALVKIWEMDLAEEPRKLTVSQILRAYKYGLISRDEAKKMLMSLGYPENYAELLIRIEEAKELQELQEERIKLVLEDLKDGVVTPEEALRALERLGVDPQRAQVLVRLALAKKKVERRERLTKADIKELFKHGLIDASMAKAMLIEIGYSENVATALVKSWEMDLAEEPRKLTTSQILRLYRTGIVSRDEAKKMLMSLGYTEHSAKLLLMLEDAQLRADLVELQTKIILEDLKDGYIDADTAVRLLMQAGVHPDKARLLVQLELAKIRGPERPRVSVSRIEKWFKLGLLNEATAREWLSRLGYTSEIIEMFIKEWKTEQHPETRGLSTSQILRAYRLGVIDRMMAKNYLISLGYSDDAAELLLRIEDAREIQDLIEEKARVILLRYRYGAIDEETARQELLDLGLAPPRVDVLIELEKARRERPPRPRRLTPTQVLRACREGIFSIEETDRYLQALGYYDPEDRLVLIYMYCYQYREGGEELRTAQS